MRVFFTRYALACLFLFVLQESNAQIISLEDVNLKQIDNNLHGYNLARQWSYIIGENANGGYNGNIDLEAINNLNNLNINTLRFPGGGTSVDYHRFRKGYGERIDEGVLNLNYTDPLVTNDGYDKIKDYKAYNDPTIYSSYAGWNASSVGNNNIIFPFMRFVKELNKDKNNDGINDNNIKILYVLNIVPHFSFHDNLRNELIQKVAEIENIQSLTDLTTKKNSGILSESFYNLVLENIEAISNLQQEIGVAGVEMGNEISFLKYRSDYTLENFTKPNTQLYERTDLHLKIYTTQDASSIKFYAALVKMYTNIIKNSVSNGNTIKIGIPIIPETNYDNQWNNYIFANLSNYATSYIIHNYFYDFQPTTLANNLVADFKNCRSTITTFLEDKKNEFSSLKNNINLIGKKLWLTEWEIKMDEVANSGDIYGPNRKKFGNTMLQGMYNTEYYMMMLEVNNLIKESGGFIEYANHQFLFDAQIGLGESSTPTYELCNLSNNTATNIVKRTNFIVAEMIRNITTGTLFAVNSSSGIIPLNTDIKTKIYYKKGISNTDGGTIYIYYSNWSESEISANLGGLTFLQTGFAFDINTITHQYAVANQMYASRGMTAFSIDETLYTNDLDKTLQYSTTSLSNLSNFVYPRYSFGCLIIKLDKYDPNGGGGNNGCSYLRLSNTGGKGDFVRIANPIFKDFSKADFTAELKVKGLTNTNYMVLLSNAPQAYFPFRNNFTLAYNRYNGYDRIEVWINGKRMLFGTCKNLYDGLWHHIAVVRYRKNISVYIDGNLCKSLLYSTTGETVTQSAYWSFGGGDKYTTGTTTWGNYFGMTGDMDNVRIWNVAKTATEINELSSSTSVSPASLGLIGYWDFNDRGSQIIYDLSTSGNLATLGETLDTDNSDPLYKNSGCNNNRLTEDIAEENTLSNEEKLIIYPNPTSNYLPTIEYQSIENKTVQLSLINMNGSIVFSKEIKVFTGMQKLALNDIALESGMYILILQQPDKQQIINKIIITN
ncbi:MAG: T9SS type A sorting domain-containing protein [Chitinophagales bacterium]|nr:T9SS type A sorting domain-containing protein [Chitinophagales bacterium]